MGNKTYRITSLGFHVPVPPSRKMSYDEASMWVACQSTGNRLYYGIDFVGND